ncbi:NB-ARC domain-containing protein, partial [Actinomadura fibrosa]
MSAEAVRGPAFGAVLRNRRGLAALTQEQLAERSGLSARTIRRLESGALERPRGATVRLLAEALGLDDKGQMLLAAASREGRHRSEPLRRLVVPRQLPADVAAFVGRADELSILDTEPATAIAIDGMAGVGKTALAVHAAHRLAPGFPDGQLFVDLHGHTHGTAPATPGDVLGRLLRALGVRNDRIPPHTDARAALYRTVLAERRVLLVLDDAADAAQVEPLLPGGPGCRALITSRRRLVALDRTLTLDVLPVEDAVALLTHTAERLAGTPSRTLAELVGRCGLLPLAVRLAAARLRSHPTWDASHLLERLDDPGERLAELEAGPRSVTAALDLSVRGLDDDQRRAYLLL